MLKTDLFQNQNNSENSSVRQLSSDLSAEAASNDDHLRGHRENLRKLARQLEQFNELPEMPPIKPLGRSLMEKKLEALTDRIHRLEQKVDVQFTDLVEMQDEMSAQIIEALEKNEDNERSLRAEIELLAAQVGEKSEVSEQVQELIDRQNTMMMQSEARLQQLKRDLDERELEFLKAKAALEQVKIDIRKLKRL